MFTCSFIIIIIFKHYFNDMIIYKGYKPFANYQVDILSYSFWVLNKEAYSWNGIIVHLWLRFYITMYKCSCVNSIHFNHVFWQTVNQFLLLWYISLTNSEWVLSFMLHLSYSKWIRLFFLWYISLQQVDQALLLWFYFTLLFRVLIEKVQDSKWQKVYS